MDTAIKQNKAQVKVITTSARWFGITYKEDTPGVNLALENFSKQGKYKDL